MNKTECESRIIEKLDEIAKIWKQYEKPHNFLEMAIGEGGYASIRGKNFIRQGEPLEAFKMGGEIRHFRHKAVTDKHGYEHWQCNGTYGEGEAYGEDIR